MQTTHDGKQVLKLFWILHKEMFHNLNTGLTLTMAIKSWSMRLAEQVDGFWKKKYVINLEWETWW